MLQRVPLKIILTVAALLWTTAAQAELDVSGRVVSSEGHGLEGAAVSLFTTENRFHQGLHRRLGELRGPETATVRSLADGHFQLTVPAAGLYTVVVDAPGRLPWQYPLALIESTSLPTIALSKATEHRLQVRDGDGQPVDGAFATIGEASRWSRQKTTFGDWLPAAQLARTGAAGELRFRRETVRGVDLVVWAPGFLEAELPSGKRGSSEVRLAAGLDRRIEVRDPFDAPAKDVLVRLGVGRWPVGLTDAEGRLTVPAPRDRSLPLELVTADGRTSSVSLLPPSPEGELETSEIFYLEEHDIEGRVLSAGGQEPLGGALLWTSADLGVFAWSDAQGRFRLPSVASADAIKLYGEAVGHLGRRTDGLPLDRAGALELVLEPAVTVPGRIVDATGSPVPDVEIQVHADLSRNNLLEPPLSVAARTDLGGRFTLTRLPEAPLYELIVRASGFAATAFTVAKPQGQEPVELVLERGRVTVGSVVDAAGRPVENAAALLYPSRGGDRERLLVDDVHVGVSGADGSFSMPHVLAGRYELGVSADGFAPLKVRGLEVTDDAEPLDLGTVYLDAESTVGGRVVDVEGRPLAGASVSYLALVYEVGASDDQLSTMKTTSTDGDGRFLIRQLAPSQALDLKVRRPGYREERVLDVEIPTAEPLLVTLEPVAQIFGRVIDEAGEAVPSAHLVIHPPSDFKTDVTALTGGPRTMTADGRGQFTLMAPEPGLYRVRASADAFLPSREREVEVRDDLSAESLTLVVRDGARVTGRVMDPDGRPVAGARLRVVEPAPERAEAAKVARSRSDGSFELDGLEVGPTRVEVVHRAFPRTERAIQLSESLHRLDVTLEPGAELRGRVVGDTRTPVVGAALRLDSLDEGRQPRKSATSEADGSFRVPGVPAGRYRLQATKEGFAEAIVEIQIDELGVLGGPIELEMEVGGVVTGRVFGLGASELEWLQIKAHRPGQRSVVGTVDFESGYRLEHLTAGEWVIEASLGDFDGRRASSRVEVEAGELYRDLDFEAGFIVAGDIRREGSPVAGALVALVREDLSTSGGARSGLDGRFVLTGVEPGRYDLNVKDPQTGYFHRRTVDIETDRELLVELQLGQVAGVGSSPSSPEAPR